MLKNELELKAHLVILHFFCFFGMQKVVVIMFYMLFVLLIRPSIENSFQEKKFSLRSNGSQIVKNSKNMTE